MLSAHIHCVRSSEPRPRRNEYQELQPIHVALYAFWIDGSKQNAGSFIKKTVSETGVRSNSAFYLGPTIEKTNSGLETILIWLMVGSNYS